MWNRILFCRFILELFDLLKVKNWIQKGCPPISFYSPANLEHNLEIAAINFITSETRVDLEAYTIELSRLFLWYKSDFILDFQDLAKSNNDQALIRFVEKYIREGDENKEKVQKLLESGIIDKVQIKYSSYDWQINFKD